MPGEPLETGPSVAPRERRNVAILAACQMVFSTSRSLYVATAPLIAYMIAANKALATLPASLVIVGTALATVPASLLMQRVGRRHGFIAGALIGAVGGVVLAAGIVVQDFWLFCAGALVYGAFAGFAQLYRFAAADAAPAAFRGKAISLVLAGGVVAAFAGPELAKLAKDMIASVEFLGAYVLLIAASLLTGLIVSFVDIPKLTAAEAAGPKRPITAIMRQPVFIVATLTALIGQSVMSLLMTATPIAMAMRQYAFGDIALVIEWHIFGMFAPGFFTGSLIRRFGVLRVIFAGLALLVVSVAVALAGREVQHFWISMLVLGVGWNFAFTGGATLLTEVYTPAERGITQGANIFLIYGAVAMASLSSGGLLHYFGWKWVSLGALPLIGIAMLATLWLALLRRSAAQPGTAKQERVGRET